MTKEEFLAKKKQLDDELREIFRQQDAKREEIDKLHGDYCRQMLDENLQYKDKKVKIEFVKAPLDIREGVTRKTCIGFLVGFTFRCTWNYEIYARIAKVKEDGTPSETKFSSQEMLPWEYMQSIEIL